MNADSRQLTALYFTMHILLLGDSLIENYDWQSRFPDHSVVNLGMAGEPVEGLLVRTGGIIGEYPADLIFIMTGINNVAMGDFDFLRSYRVMLKNLSAAYPDARLIIHSLLPTLLDFIQDGSIRDVNKSLEQMAEQGGVEYLDLYRLFINEKGQPVADYLLDDGIHLSDKGYAVWSAALEGVIGKTV